MKIAIMLVNKIIAVLVTGVLFLPAMSVAEEKPDDVLFYFVEKVVHYDQSATGRLKFRDYGFATAIFGTGKGKIESAQVLIPGDKGYVEPEDAGRMYVYVHDKYKTIKALNADYPDGEYHVSIKSEHNNIDHQRLTMTGKGRKKDHPAAPKVKLTQGGKKVKPGNIDPDQDLTLSWTPFRTGQADPRGILDDIIIVLTDDCKGNVAGSSGLPFTDRYLTFRDDSYTIKAGSLKPGVPYSFRVEHIRNTDTARYGNVPALAVYVVITVVDIHTIGEPVDSNCAA